MKPPKVHLVFLTYEPKYCDSSVSNQLLKFYETNIIAYDAGLKEMDGELVLLDTASDKLFLDFLNNIAQRLRLKCILIKDNLSSFDAFNFYIQNNKNEDDIYIWIPSDTRPSQGDWCQRLIKDMADTSALLAYPTVTTDGSQSTAQTQVTPTNRNPRVVEFPNYCNLVACALHGRLLKICNWQLPNKFKKNGNDKGLSLLAKISGTTAIISFRSHLVHYQEVPGRHKWTNDESRSGRELEYVRQSVIESGLMAIGRPRLEFSTYMQLLDDRGVGPVRAFINYMRMLSKYIFTKQLRSSLIDEYAMLRTANKNMAKLMNLPLKERLKVIKDLYWEMK